MQSRSAARAMVHATSRTMSPRAARAAALALGAALAVAFLPARAAAAPATLDYRGTVLPRRQVETFATAALRTPRDSAEVGRCLGRMVATLEDLGYLDATAHASFDTTAAPRLAIVVREGMRYRVSTVTLRAAGREDSLRIAAALTLRQGAWASPSGMSEAVTRAVQALVDQGYAYATLGVTGWEADSGRVAVTLSGTPGPRVTVTRVRVDGLHVTRPALTTRVLGRLAGGAYSPAAVEAGRQRLAQLGLFESVTVAGLEGESDWSRGQVVYRVQEPRYNRFEGAVGVQGAAGTAGLAKLDLGNLMGTGRALSLSWESRGRGLANLSARYAEPLVFGTPIGLEGTLTQQVQDTLYTRTTWGGRATLQLSPDERLEVGLDEERVVQAAGDIEEADLENTVLAVERSTLDDPLAPRRGLKLRVSAAQVFKTERLRPPGTSHARASALEAASEWARGLTSETGLGLEIHAAGRFSSERVLPIFERYPLGGATTLRGYDEEAFRVDRYALSRLEWRRYLGAGRERAFLFWDHAWMSTRLALDSGGDQVQTLQRDGVGFGLRLVAGGGVLGVDYGLEPGRPPLEGKIHLRLVTLF